MAVIDKNNMFKCLDAFFPIILELGCGMNKRNAGAIGIDILDYPDVDLVGDIYEALALFPDGSVDAVYSYHFIEHLTESRRLLTELDRIVKHNSIVEFVAPHFSNPHFYSDPTHHNVFGLYTFCYFANNSPFQRSVPDYGYNTNFSIESVDLLFKSSKPFIFRHALKKTIGSLFNSCTYMQELYEENFCYLFPCYEVQYRLRRQ